MNSKKYRFSHVGMPTTEKRENEKYFPDLDLYLTEHDKHEFHVEFLRFGKNSKMPEIVRKMPHIAFEVDDMDEAIKGREVVIQPSQSSKGKMAFILVDGALVELLQLEK